MARFSRSLSLVSAVALSTLSAAGGCSKSPPLMLWVDGFAPENVSFDAEDLGRLDDAALMAQRVRPDIDGVMRLPAGSCDGPCRATRVTVFVVNRGKTPEAPPVVRLDAPAGRVRRLPIAFHVPQVDPGRTGRVRWVVEMWPEEQQLTATLSSSVSLDVSVSTPAATTPPPAASMPTTPPATPTTSDQ
jgi:hypothetical protein